MLLTDALSQEAVHAALRLWYKDSDQGSPLGHLTLFHLTRREQGSVRRATNWLLLQALQHMETENPKGATLLRKHFLDGQTISAIANQLNLHESAVYPRQRRALQGLTEILWAMEQAARAARERALEARQGAAACHAPIGLDALMDQVGDILLDRGPPWIVSLEGIGGIGKTTLAHTVTWQIIQQGKVDEFGWVSAQPSVLHLGGTIRPVARPALTVEALVDLLASQLMGPSVAASRLPAAEAFEALRQRLRERPHLIVIDNLETVLDVESLLPALRRLTDPTKFLLTSRESLYVEPDVYHVMVPQLSERDAMQLVRQEAGFRNLGALAEASDDDLRPIYRVVGGNPLALRLLVGQAHVHELPTILHDLVAARGGTVENLYTFIYRRAWDHLDALARRALLAMPLVAERGGRFEYLLDITLLAADDLRQALDRLVTRNLVDVRGGLTEKRYTIHNLTRTFLQEQAARWQMHPSSP